MIEFALILTTAIAGYAGVGWWVVILMGGSAAPPGERQVSLVVVTV
ncbi:MAG: hypothetical protein K0U74_12010 [Alphaproteobacteria bacterium]|nr:hypothetical protein [Alphaproteobacteria bacterium]